MTFVLTTIMVTLRCRVDSADPAAATTILTFPALVTVTLSQASASSVSSTPLDSTVSGANLGIMAMHSTRSVGVSFV